MVNTTQKRPEVFLENMVFYLSILLLAATIGSFFYVRYLTEIGRSGLADISAQAAKTKIDEQKQLESKINSARQKLEDFSKVVAERKSVVGFFRGLEELTTKNVYFSKCNLDLEKMAASLSGRGYSFQDVGRQSAKFNAAKGLESAFLGKTAAGSGGGIEFETNLVIKPEMVVPR